MAGLVTLQPPTVSSTRFAGCLIVIDSLDAVRRQVAAKNLRHDFRSLFLFDAGRQAELLVHVLVDVQRTAKARQDDLAGFFNPPFYLAIR